MYGLANEWFVEARPRHPVRADYEGAGARWCAACGDRCALSVVQRLMRTEGLPPDKTVVVSGVGCASQVPHRLQSYGFYAPHGRALPIAEGVRCRRPDLHLFVITGDGDSLASGTAHLVHAVRYNMKMVVMLFDGDFHGQPEPRSAPARGSRRFSSKPPEGGPPTALNPLAITLGIPNVSFVAQTADFCPAHMFAVLSAAHQHDGLAFVRVLQRCPHRAEGAGELASDLGKLRVLTHEHGVAMDPELAALHAQRRTHDPSDLVAAQALAARQDTLPIGLLYRNSEAERYDRLAAARLGISPEEKLQALERELDRFMS